MSSNAFENAWSACASHPAASSLFRAAATDADPECRPWCILRVANVHLYAFCETASARKPNIGQCLEPGVRDNQMRFNIRNMSALGIAGIGTLAASLSVPGAACTRILWNDNKLGVFVGRTMDFPVSTEPVLTVLPRGLKHDGGLIDGKRIDANAVKWTSKYGSIVTSAMGVGTADGVNEKGVGMHILYFVPVDFGPRDKTKAGLQAVLWGQYVLDNAASVTEALTLLETVQPLMVEHNGVKATLHLAIEDSTGDSAIVEYVAPGKKTVYHGREHRILTNDPSYDQHLSFRAAFNFEGATRQTMIPGNVDARDRFVRADYYRGFLPEPKDTREAIASILAITRNVSVPFGAPNRAPGSLYNTEYRTAIDLGNRRYYFELTTSPNVIWADLSKFDLSEGQPVRLLRLDDMNLVGDVSGKFKIGTINF
jgi:choloylglycine hydrolase